MDSRTPLEMLLELDSRHDELLDRLADLDKRVKTVLAHCQPTVAKEPPLPSEALPVHAGGSLAGPHVVVHSTVTAAPTLDGVF